MNTQKQLGEMTYAELLAYTKQLQKDYDNALAINKKQDERVELLKFCCQSEKDTNKKLQDSIEQLQTTLKRYEHAVEDLERRFDRTIRESYEKTQLLKLLGSLTMGLGGTETGRVDKRILEEGHPTSEY